MIISGTVKKKSILLAALVTVLFVLMAVCLFSAYADDIHVGTAKQRSEYLKSIGIGADTSAETVKTIEIPTVFSDVYNNYNELQKKAGFDLAKYAGEKAVLYTYTVSNNEKICFYVNLITYKGRLIGGDVSTCSLDGYMVPLIKEEVQKCLK